MAGEDRGVGPATALLFLIWSSVVVHPGRRRWVNLPKPTAASSSTATATPTAAPAAASSSSAILLFTRLVLGFRSIVNKEGIERQAVGEDDVADGVAANGHGVEALGLAALYRHTHRFKRDVHDWRDAGDGAISDSAILEFDGNSLILTLHQEAATLLFSIRASMPKILTEPV